MVNELIQRAFPRTELYDLAWQAPIPRVADGSALPLAGWLARSRAENSPSCAGLLGAT